MRKSLITTGLAARCGEGAGLRRQRLPGIRHDCPPTGLLCDLPTN
jgi:hypothetical protein